MSAGVGWVGLVAVVVASLWGLAPGPSDAAALFDLPFRSQLDGAPYALSNCGPTALGMALAYYGVDASSWELRVRAMRVQHSWVDDEGGYSDRYGVFIYNLGAVAESYGLHALGLWRYEGGHVDRLREWQPADLRRELGLGRPVIVQVAYRALPSHRGSRATDDHYIVLHGFFGDDFLYSDPMGADDSAAALTISTDDLMWAMGRAETPRVGFALAAGPQR